MSFDQICKEYFEFVNEVVHTGVGDERWAKELYLALKEVEFKQRKIELEEKAIKKQAQNDLQ